MTTVDHAAQAAPWPTPAAAGESFVTRVLVVVLVCLVACGTVHAAAAPQADSFLTRDASLSVFLSDVDKGLVHTVYADHGEIVWRPDGQRLWSATDQLGLGITGKPIDGLAEVMAEAEAVNPAAKLVVLPQDYGRWWVLRGLGILGGLGALLLLVAGPQPRRANRWAWFWLVYVGRTSGLGVLAFLILGTRRRRRADLAGQHRADARPRLDGWQGFALAFVGGLLVMLVGALLQDAFVGDRSGQVPLL